MTAMRAKVKVGYVYQGFDQKTKEQNQENLVFFAVCKSGAYPEDGTDENNSFAKWTPNAKFELSITNPALWGKFEPGKEYYVDFTPASN